MTGFGNNKTDISPVDKYGLKIKANQNFLDEKGLYLQSSHRHFGPIRIIIGLNTDTSSSKEQAMEFQTVHFYRLTQFSQPQNTIGSYKNKIKSLQCGNLKFTIHFPSITSQSSSKVKKIRNRVAWVGAYV